MTADGKDDLRELPMSDSLEHYVTSGQKRCQWWVANLNPNGRDYQCVLGAEHLWPPRCERHFWVGRAGLYGAALREIRKRIEQGAQGESDALDVLLDVDKVAVDALREASDE